MKKLIVENQNDFRLSLTGELTSAKGIKYKKLYIAGNTASLNAYLKSINPSQDNKGIKSKYGAEYDGTNKQWYWLIYGANGAFDTQRVIDTKIKPFIAEVNEFYKYTLNIDELISGLENFTPKNENEATPEQANEIANRLSAFKERLLNMSSSEELHNIMKLMMTVKNGKSEYPYSPNNKIAIKIQRPTATIVCNPNNWKKWYNRTVNPGAEPIFVNSTTSGGYDANITRDFLNSVGVSSQKNLSGNQKAQLHAKQNQAKYGDAKDFAWIKFYDVADTTQIPGTEDEIGRDAEEAAAAAAELSGRNLDSDTQTSTEIAKIKPVYDGLLAYAQAQNIGVNKKETGNQAPNITASQNVDANTTKSLASALLSQILHGEYLKNRGGVASKVASDITTPEAKRQQSEVASWQFMEAFDIKYNLADVDFKTIFGTVQANKNPEQEKRRIAGNINDVLKAIEGAVNHLIDFVNVEIKDNANLNETDGDLPQGKHVTVSGIAKDLGIPNDMLNELNIQTLKESILRKLKLKLLN